VRLRKSTTADIIGVCGDRVSHRRKMGVVEKFLEVVGHRRPPFRAPVSTAQSMSASEPPVYEIPKASLMGAHPANPIGKRPNASHRGGVYLDAT
jgi:hypothetical protein